MRGIGTKRTGLRMLAVGAALAMVLAACGGDDDNSNASATSAAPETTTTAATSDANATVKVATTDVGKTLVDANGMTLYALEKDSKNMSTCVGGCATAWPPLTVTGKVVVAKGLDAEDFATFSRTDPAATQVTVYGAPLYTFSGDKAPGDTNGKTVPNWYVVGANGKKMEGAAAATTTPTTTDSGY
jgi:predicted lipoprotein with Yx(FWY)xxD motif